MFHCIVTGSIHKTISEFGQLQEAVIALGGDLYLPQQSSLATWPADIFSTTLCYLVGGSEYLDKESLQRSSKI